jgi:hypothetical protein
MGKASRAKRDRRINQATSGGVTPAQDQRGGFVTGIEASGDSASIRIFVDDFEMTFGDAVVFCLIKGDAMLLETIEEGVNMVGKTCLDLRFAHPRSGLANADVLGLAVAFEAESCLNLLVVTAGRTERWDQLALHLSGLLSCVDRAEANRPATFARRRLKQTFARTDARSIGFGPQADRLVAEIEAEELAAAESHELEAFLAAAPRGRSAARAL